MNQIMVQEDFDINIVLGKPLMAYLSSLKEYIPCSSPLWFLYDDSKLWLFGTEKDSFIQRLDKNPNCAVSVVDFDLKSGILRHVGLRGSATVIEVDQKKLDNFLYKYLGSNKANWNEWFVKNIVIPLNRMAVINPSSVVAKDVSFFKNKMD